MKRDYPLRFECAHPECPESVTFRYQTRRDLVNSFEARNYQGGKWKCVRHQNPDRVLSTNNRQTTFEIVSDERPHGRYFGSMGLLSGPGFLAYAGDFPPGTKLIVTAKIELPDVAADSIDGADR